MLSYQLEKYLYSSWQKDTRFYIIELCQDLWGNWLLKTTWGSAIKSAWATAGFPRHVEPRKTEIWQRSISTVCPDYEAGVKLYYKAQKRRLSRGYNLLSAFN